MTEKNSEFKAAVGLSQKWDAYDAGREVVIDTLNKLGEGVEPKFFIIFSTIHYKEHGGFKKLLEGARDVLPEGIPLIGGTIQGFIIPQGCFVRGVAALAVYYPQMDVAVGFGKNTRRNPKHAAMECIKMIKPTLDKSQFENGFLYNMISDTIVGLITGATAGLMIYITADEIIPTSCSKEIDHKTIFSLLVGIIFVLLLGLIQ